MTDTDARLAALKALADKATPGPWRIGGRFEPPFGANSIGVSDKDAIQLSGSIIDYPLEHGGGSHSNQTFSSEFVEVKGDMDRDDLQPKHNRDLIVALRNDAIPLAEALMKERDEARAERDELKARIANALL